MQGIKQFVHTKIKKISTIIKSSTYEQCIAIIGGIILVVMGLLHAVEAGHYVDFIPINGTFQDYNPVRRFLNEQIPYKDFQDYLGLGHLYIGSIFTALFGGKYVSSLIAFRFIAFLSTAIIIYLILYVVTKKSTTAISITNILLAIFLIQPTFFEAIVGDNRVKSALEYAMSTGNSARMLRGMVLPLSSFLLIIIFRIRALITGKCQATRKIFIMAGMVGCLAGLCLPWSNDYGISCWLCLLIMTFILTVCKTRSVKVSFGCFLLAIVASIISMFVIVEIVTIGHFTEWISATFGTGGYQAWYYNSDKSYYITDVDFSYMMMIQALLCVFYIIRLWKTKAENESVLRYGILAYVNMTAFCATNEYKLLSGGSSYEVAMVVLFGTIVSEIINYVKKYFDKPHNTTLNALSLIVCCAWIVSTSVDEVEFWALTEKDGVYIEQLGGYIRKLGDDLLATDEFLDDKTTFATYASAQELLSANFQPSGTDYLIHVLGDKQREKYLEAFENGEFNYAVTINENYSGWEFWLQRANWFFYESLFENWHPVYANSYEIYWERNDENQGDTLYCGDDINVSIVQLDENTQKIIVQTNSFISGTASVFVDYAVEKVNNRSSKLLFNKMLNVTNSGEKICNYDTFESNNLRDVSKEYIPVPIINGYGEVTLTGKPEKSTYLQVNYVECTKIYRVQYQYIQIDEIIKFGNSTALHVVNNNRTQKILAGISSISIGESEYIIDGIENQCIIISNADNVNDDMLKYNNMFKVR